MRSSLSLDHVEDVDHGKLQTSTQDTSGVKTQLGHWLHLTFGIVLQSRTGFSERARTHTHTETWPHRCSPQLPAPVHPSDLRAVVESLELSLSGVCQCQWSETRWWMAASVKVFRDHGVMSSGALCELLRCLVSASCRVPTNQQPRFQCCVYSKVRTVAERAFPKFCDFPHTI